MKKLVFLSLMTSICLGSINAFSAVETRIANEQVVILKAEELILGLYDPQKKLVSPFQTTEVKFCLLGCNKKSKAKKPKDDEIIFANSLTEKLQKDSTAFQMRFMMLSSDRMLLSMKNTMPMLSSKMAYDNYAVVQVEITDKITRTYGVVCADTCLIDAISNEAVQE